MVYHRKLFQFQFLERENVELWFLDSDTFARTHASQYRKIYTIKFQFTENGKFPLLKRCICRI